MLNADTQTSHETPAADFSVHLQQLPVVLTPPLIAALFGRSLSTTLADISRNPSRLPPQIRVAGGVLFLTSTVMSWLAEHEIKAEAPAPKPRNPEKPAGGPRHGAGAPGLEATSEAFAAGFIKLRANGTEMGDVKSYRSAQARLAEGLAAGVEGGAK